MGEIEGTTQRGPFKQEDEKGEKKVLVLESGG